LIHDRSGPEGDEGSQGHGRSEIRRESAAGH
jgi:hypothetical protein